MKKLFASLILSFIVLTGYAQSIQNLVVSTENNASPVLLSAALNNSTLDSIQLTADIFPVSANQNVTWSISSVSSGIGTVNSSGLLIVGTQTSGEIWAKATSVADPAIADSIKILVYCKPGHTNPINWFVIDTVRINGTSLNSASTGLGNENAYTFFEEGAASTATLEIGNTYTLESFVTASYGVANTQQVSYSLWIDYNRNGIFETSEWVEVTSGTLDSFITESFTIPNNADTGKTLMRVRTRIAGSNNFAGDACTSFNGSGQTEDYVVTLASGNANTCTNTIPGLTPGDLGCVSFTYQNQLTEMAIVRAADGNVWLQQNLGSSQVGLSKTDSLGFGDYFQWGRWDDGHQLKNSTTALASSLIFNNPAGLTTPNSNFITGTGSAAWWDNSVLSDTWNAENLNQVNDTNGLDPCMAISNDWRLPTELEWENVINLEQIGDTDDAYNSNLKLTVGGTRSSSSGNFDFVGQRGYYWSSTTSSLGAKNLYYSDFIVNPNAGNLRGAGASVRCIYVNNTLSNIDSVKVNLLNNHAPIAFSSVLATQPQDTIQLESTVYPLTSNQDVVWTNLTGTNNISTPIGLTGLVTIPTQTQGISWNKAHSIIDSTKSDSLRLQIYCKPNPGNSNFFKFDTVQIIGTPFNHHTPNNIANYNFILEGPTSTATLISGETYTLRTVIRESMMSASEYTYSLWIDYNRNGIFEASEWTELVGGTGTTDSVTNISFSIPGTITEGKTLMRLKTRMAGGVNDPASVCGGLTNSGHIQDFVVSLLDTNTIPITGLTVSTVNNVPATIPTNGGTLDLEATILPSTANQDVTWSIIPNTGDATVNAAGLVTAISDGTVWAKAVSVSDATKLDSLEVTISNQIISITDVTVSTVNNVPATININGGTLDLEAIVLPSTANQDVTWSIIPNTGDATINTSGVVTALSNGTVWAKAVSIADATKSDSLQVTISNQIIPITSLAVSTLNNAPATIDVNAGTLDLEAIVLPSTANQNVIWSIIPNTGDATINTSGTVTAISDGTVWAKAVSVSDATKLDSLEVTISNQIIPITSLTVSTVNNVPAIIDVNAGILELEAVILPLNADQDVIWSIVPNTGDATINTSGTVTAITDGTVWAKAVSVSDATTLDSLEVTISNQIIPITSLTVSTVNNVPAIIDVNEGTLELEAVILPLTADQGVIWSIVPNTGDAIINTFGTVTAISDGTVWAKAVSVSDATKSDSLEITIAYTNSVSQIDRSKEFKIYPNPANQYVTIESKENHPDGTIFLMDVYGRKVFQMKVNANQMKGGLMVNLKELSSGVYFIKFESTEFNLKYQIIKK